MSFFVRLDFDSRQGIQGRTYQETGREREKKRKGRWLAQRGLTFKKKKEKKIDFIDFNCLFIYTPPPNPTIAQKHYTLAHSLLFSSMHQASCLKRALVQ